MKLNLGSNNIRIPGYTNVDLVAHENVDIVANAISLPQEDNSVDEILSSHLIEHFHFHDGLKALKEWFRVLKPGGKLIIECPDLEAFCRNFLKLSEEERPRYYVQLFGYPWEDGQSHKFGYTHSQIIWSLQTCGFHNIKELPAWRYMDIVDWCMKFECEKPLDVKISYMNTNVNKKHVLCAIPTKGRHMTTLPMAISAVINQTVKPQELVIFDDSDEFVDLRTIPMYENLFHLLDMSGIKWQVLIGKKLGQHFSHQISQEIAKQLIWRVDDDTVPEPNVLEILLSNMSDDVGAVGGLVLHDNPIEKECGNNLLSDMSDNCQWYIWEGKKEVEHLYSTFLYRKGLVDYELSLSKACHTEETIFSHKIFKKGYKLIVDSNARTKHLKYKDGGIRTYTSDMFEHDYKIFQELQREWNGEIICYLDNGKGDHIVFKSILPEIKNKFKKVTIACCYPDLFDGENLISLDNAKKIITPDRLNIYKFMSDRNWKTELVDAFRKMYLEEN